MLEFSDKRSERTHCLPVLCSGYGGKVASPAETKQPPVHDGYPKRERDSLIPMEKSTSPLAIDQRSDPQINNQQINQPQSKQSIN